MPSTFRPTSTRMNQSRRNCLSSLTILGCASFIPSLAGASTFELSSYRGKLVYLDFWASWCGPCLQSFPWLAQMHEKYANQGLQVIAVNLDRDRKAADRFLKRVPAPFALVFDPQGSLAERFKVSGMPHSFLFDRNGRQLSDHIGFLANEKPKREEAIKAALAA